MSDYQQISVREAGDVVVVRFAQPKIVDEADIQELGEELYSLVTKDQREAILLNFGDVRFLSSAALGKLIKLEKMVKQQGGKLKLSDIRPEIKEVFMITRLDRVFEIKETEEEAIAAF